MKILAFIGSVIIWTGAAYGQDSISQPGSFEIWPGSGLKNSFSSHRETEQHYSSCRQYTDQITAYAASQVLEVQRLAAIINDLIDDNPTVGSCGSFVDGQGGAVYKPESETTGKIVFLLPASYCDGTRSLISEVKILSKATGQEVATSQLRHCGTANQNRLHWNINATAEQLTRHGAILVVYKFNGVEECREIPNPLVRYD